MQSDETTNKTPNMKVKKKIPSKQRKREKCGNTGEKSRVMQRKRIIKGGAKGLEEQVVPTILRARARV